MRDVVSFFSAAFMGEWFWELYWGLFLYSCIGYRYGSFLSIIRPFPCFALLCFALLCSTFLSFASQGKPVLLLLLDKVNTYAHTYPPTQQSQSAKASFQKNERERNGGGFCGTTTDPIAIPVKIIDKWIQNDQVISVRYMD